MTVFFLINKHPLVVEDGGVQVTVVGGQTRGTRRVSVVVSPATPLAFGTAGTEYIYLLLQTSLFCKLLTLLFLFMKKVNQEIVKPVCPVSAASG